jgi:hypothetical protein
METICSFETSVDIQQTTGRYIAEGRTHHNHRRENLKSLYLCSSLGFSQPQKTTDIITLPYLERLNERNN